MYRIENAEIGPPKCNHLIFDEEAKTIWFKKDVLSTNDDKDVHMKEKEKQRKIREADII